MTESASNTAAVRRRQYLLLAGIGGVIVLATVLSVSLTGSQSTDARPLKPRVVVHDPAVPREEALILDLEHPDAPGIRRSLKPSVLPRAALDYLSPRVRICYFFERAMSVDTGALMA